MKHAQSFPAQTGSIAQARRFTARALDGSPPDVTDAVVLMVSELATNCIRHVNSAFQLSIERSGSEIRVEVSDHSGSLPSLQSPGPDDLGGRGLRIIELLSDRWGVTADPVGGKTVWFSVEVGSLSNAVSADGHGDTTKASGPAQSIRTSASPPARYAARERRPGSPDVSSDGRRRHRPDGSRLLTEPERQVAGGRKSAMSRQTSSS